MMSNNPENIAILVSFFGSCTFLKAFLDSLSGQTFQNFRLLYRFDGPVPQEKKDLLLQYPFAVKVGDDEFKGIPMTYWDLLSRSGEYPYVMFADQDDVWHPGKIEKSFAAMQKMESGFGKDMPLLVHSNLQVSDMNEKILAESFFDYQSLNPRLNRLKDLMVQNNVTGCATLFNRALVRRVKNPAPAICHDWYLALIASAFGKIGFLEEPLIDYRQHDKNFFGAVTSASLLFGLLHRQKLHERLVLTQKQAQLFLQQFREELTPEQIQSLEAWSSLLTEPRYLKRLAVVLQNRFRKNDWLRTLGMLWAL